MLPCRISYCCPQWEPNRATHLPPVASSKPAYLIVNVIINIYHRNGEIRLDWQSLCFCGVGDKAPLILNDSLTEKIATALFFSVFFFHFFSFRAKIEFLLNIGLNTRHLTAELAGEGKGEGERLFTSLSKKIVNVPQTSFQIVLWLSTFLFGVRTHHISNAYILQLQNELHIG